MQAPPDIRVHDLEAAVTHATTLSPHQPQPQPHVQVCLDPAGHPFCRYLDE